MALRTKQVSVGTTAVLVLGPQSNPVRMILHNANKASNNFIWFGGNSAVTTSTGAHIDNSETYELVLGTGNELWAISDEANRSLHVLWQDG
jgi:hypothetical protein